jgi:hypothetical protein
MRRLWTALVMVASLTACELGLERLAPGEPELVVHGVLSPTATNQVVLLERTHTGSRLVERYTFSSFDPITTDFGVPEENATVFIETPSGQMVQGFEPVGFSKIGGMYVFPLPGASLVAGLYRLTITTTAAEQVSASTVLPAATAAPVSLTRVFDRTADTVELQWAPVPAARGYSVRIDGPHGPFLLMTEQTSIRLTGELRHVNADGMPRAFVPGFTQSVSVSAVDSNFYDYYRTQMDASTGSGIISRVSGALGFFGSLVPVFVQPFEVTSPNVEPIDGRFDRIQHSAQQYYFANFMELHMESRSRNDLGDAVSGYYTLNETGTRRYGILGSTLRDSVTLVFLSDVLASDTAEVFRGRLKGDTVTGKFSKGAIGIFVRQ